MISLVWVPATLILIVFVVLLAAFMCAWLYHYCETYKTLFQTKDVKTIILKVWQNIYS